MFGINDFSEKIVDFANFDVSQLGSALAFGGAILLIGMLTVFSVLVILWGCLTLFKLFFHDLPAKKKAETKSVEVAPAPVAPAPVSNDDEIVAVIAAAIAAAESECSGLKFRVVSFKRH